MKNDGLNLCHELIFCLSVSLSIKSKYKTGGRVDGLEIAFLHTEIKVQKGKPHRHMMHAANTHFKCYRCFKNMLQVFYKDVVHVAMGYTRMF